MMQTGPKISVIGHASIDYLINVQDTQVSPDDLNVSFYVDAEKYYGGTGMNVAYAAAKMGADIRFLTCVGNDFVPPNDFINNITLRTIKYQNLEEPRTPTCFIFSGNENQVTYIADNTLEHYNGIQDSCMYCDSQCVHLTTTPIEFSLRTAQQTQDKSDAVVSWSPGQNLRLWDIDSFKRMIKNVNVLFVNEHEMDIVIDKFDMDMTELMRTMSASHDRLIIVTRGSQGALLRHHRYLTPFELDAIPIDNAVDTTGCGDAFTGAFLSQMLNCKMTLPNCLRFASSVASFVAEKEGSQTNIPTFDEAFERMNKYYEVK